MSLQSSLMVAGWLANLPTSAQGRIMGKAAFQEPTALAEHSSVLQRPFETCKLCWMIV